MGKHGRVDWQTLDDYRKVASINLFGLIEVTMTFLPLIKKERGRLVNMGTTDFQRYVFSSGSFNGITSWWSIFTVRNKVAAR